MTKAELIRASLNPVPGLVVNVFTGSQKSVKGIWRYATSREEDDGVSAKDLVRFYELLERYVYIADQDKFFDCEAGGFFKPEAIGRTHAHKFKKTLIHTLLLRHPKCQKVRTITYLPGRERIVENAINIWRAPDLKLPPVSDR